MTGVGQRPLVLVAEDEIPISEMLVYNLEKSGFEVMPAFDGESALQLANELECDAMVLDWMMPGLTGIEVCKAVRDGEKNKNIPILMLTARGDEDDRVYGLEAGADDYMVKPFSPRELVARINALIRRTKNIDLECDLNFGPISINVTQHKVLVEGVLVKLGPTEYRLLKFLMESPGRVFSRSYLLEKVWSYGGRVESRTVDVHVRRLRKALLDVGGIDPIRTVRGSGYSFDMDHG